MYVYLKIRPRNLPAAVKQKMKVVCLEMTKKDEIYNMILLLIEGVCELGLSNPDSSSFHILLIEVLSDENEFRHYKLH